MGNSTSFFIGQNYDLQWTEFSSPWKFALLGSIFALGLGLSTSKSKGNHWGVIFGGLCGPILIYYFKYFAALITTYLDFNLPEALVLFSSGVSSFYIPKISYVFYCLPAFAVSLGYLLKLLKSKDIDWQGASMYITVIIAVLGIFYLENVKNSLIYSLLLALISFAFLLKKGIKTLSLKSYCLILGLGFLILSFAFNNLRANNFWQTFSADIKAAIHAEPVEVWNKSTYANPFNADGRPVSPTSFDRTFYFMTALEFKQQHPLGYSLVHSTFGHIARQSFPKAPLVQSYSAWMDFTLALGIPGAAILLAASILAMPQVSTVNGPMSIFCIWPLLSVVLLFLTTEVSQKKYIDTYVWLIALVSSLGLKNPHSSIFKRNAE